MHLPDGESNPGLPRDRRGYLPLYYRGLAGERVGKNWDFVCSTGKSLLFSGSGKERHREFQTKQNSSKNGLASRSRCKKYSFEPDLNQRPMDLCYSQLQSTALPTELSKEACKQSKRSTTKYVQGQVLPVILAACALSGIGFRGVVVITSA